MTPARFLILFAALSCGGDTEETPARCGDGRATGAEDCDAADLRGRTCADLGFTGGALACTTACVFDVRACNDAEICDNGVDDDGDGLKDCDDPDCADAAACAVCGDGRVSGGETCDDGNTVAGDCCDHCHAEPGCEVEPDDATGQAMALAPGAEVRGVIAPAGDVDVYQLVVPAGSTGTLVAETSASAAPDDCFGVIDSIVAILDAGGAVSAEDDDAGQGTCSRARAVGLAPGKVYVRVAAGPLAAAPTFAYRLTLELALAPCGDGVLQEGQECDDGNTVDGDGCSSACRLEPVTEHEPDDTLATAGGPLAPPFAVLGTIDTPAAALTDADWYALELAAPATLRVETRVVGASTCATTVVDATLLDAGGKLLAAPGAPGADPRSCGVVTAAVPAGRAYVRVDSRPAPGAYKLLVTMIASP